MVKCSNGLLTVFWLVIRWLSISRKIKSVVSQSGDDMFFSYVEIAILTVNLLSLLAFFAKSAKLDGMAFNLKFVSFGQSFFDGLDKA